MENGSSGKMLWMASAVVYTILNLLYQAVFHS